MKRSSDISSERTDILSYHRDIINKYKLRGRKRSWYYNVEYFEKLLNDPEETEFFFLSRLETNTTKISGKYKRWVINYLLKSQKNRANKFPDELNYIFLDIKDILNSEIYTVESQVEFQEWLKNKMPKFSDWSAFEPVLYQELPQRYRDFFDEEIANKGYLFKCYFVDDPEEYVTYIFLLASTKELNDDIYQTFFSNQE